MKKHAGIVLGLAVVLAGCAKAQDGALPSVAPKAGWDTLPPAKAAEGDWPWWRGPNRDNLAPAGQKPPAAWGAGSNIVWQAHLPGTGHSSPSVVGERIYITSCDAASGAVSLFALERATGKTVWQAEISKGGVAKQHPDNSMASPSPACDGERVFVPYQNDKDVGLAAVGVDGKVLWNKSVSAYNTMQGFSASATFYKSAVIVPVEGPAGCYLTAFHRATGEVVWRSAIRKVDEGYGSPIVVRVAGRDQLVLVGGETTRGYEPENGAQLWECRGAARVYTATAAVGPDIVYSTGGHPKRMLMAIRADGKGDVTQSHVVWTSDVKAGYVPSPVLFEGLLYAVNDQGLMRCYDAADGKVLWEEDFKTPFYSSPVVANGKVYAFDRKGKGYVMTAGRQAGAIITNELPSGVFSTPVILNGRIYLRTEGDFYCIGEKP